MKIALIGYGKMGHIIEKVALERGHEITCRIDAGDEAAFDSEEFRHSDVAIEFTVPSAAVDNIIRCFRASVPVVCGTTGWYDRLPEVKKMCEEGRCSMIAASNFSIGVNVFMEINSRLAKIMNRFGEYTPRMVETHHVHKLDHPSGTAITLAEGIINNCDRVTGWEEPERHGKVEDGILEIDAIRSGEVPGIHTIIWDSSVDSISITHDAKNREGFALGAVLAAEWLPAHPGFRTIREVLGLSKD